MKKIFGLLALLLAFGCDDGDMSLNTFDFSAVQPQSCPESNIVYKVNGTEVLILNLDDTALANVVATEDNPRIITVGSGNNTIIYRNYDGPVSTGANGTLCSEIPPANPSVMEEWTGEGTISIVTAKRFNADNELTGFTHQITLLNITFTRAGETIIINNNSFGTVDTPLGYTFDFFDDEGEPLPVYECENGFIYKRDAKEALVMDLEANLFPNEETPDGTPRTQAIDENNSITLRVYDGNVTSASICDVVQPLDPTEVSRWRATEGTISVTTTYNEADAIYEHQIRLLDMIFENTSNASETIEITDFNFGTYTTD